MSALPPFDALIAFEAALRTGTVTAAARDLGVTQSAISHRLRRLEIFMGAPLLLRTAHGVTPTPAGKALAIGLTDLLQDLGHLRARCRAAVAPTTLKVGVGSALADYWLVARLPAFVDAHPGTNVELIIAEGPQLGRGIDLDVQVHWVPEAAMRPSSSQRLLFREHVFPVCRPNLLPPDMRGEPASLASLPLLHKGAADRSNGTEWAWPTWFERLGLARAPRESMRFANIGTAIAAALQGHGVVLGRSLLVHDALADGRLVRVLAPTWDMPSSKVHVVRWSPARTADARVSGFISWLIAQAKAADASGVAAVSCSPPLPSHPRGLPRSTTPLVDKTRQRARPARRP